MKDKEIMIPEGINSLKLDNFRNERLWINQSRTLNVDDMLMIKKKKNAFTIMEN